MKCNLRHILLLILVLTGMSVRAEWTCYPEDLQRLSEHGIYGTARYVSMAGAMTAVGGDVSAVLDNPAGLGVYRRMEVSATLDFSYDRTSSDGSEWVKPKSGMPIAFTHAAWVTSLLSGQSRGVVANNVMLSYRRLANFRRNMSCSNLNSPASLMQVIADKTNAEGGLKEFALKDYERWDNNEVGWLSIMGYDNYLIDPVGESSWSAAYGQVGANQLELEEYGYVNEYSATWALNMSHHLYVGVGLNIESQMLRRTARYTEVMDNGNFFSTENSVWLSGVGFNANFGVIYHPIRCLRLGASFQTPTLNSLRLQTTSAAYSTMNNRAPYNQDGEGNPVKTKPIDWTGESLSQRTSGLLPFRASLGVAGQLKRLGLLSLQYDFQRGRMTTDVHALKAGFEFVLWDRIFLNAGYACMSSFLSDKKQKQWVEDNKRDYNSVRLDTDFRQVAMSQYASVGVGYRGVWGRAQVAYQYGWQQMNVYAHELATPYDVHTQTHRVVLTLDWHTF